MKIMETYRRLPQQITERGPWQQTTSGKAFFLADPRVEEVDLVDLAFALSRQTRYNGHMRDGVEHYSIAQHEVLISQWMEKDGCSLVECYAGLHHDTPEGYYGDFISQVKYCVPEVRPFAAKIDAVVDEALGIRWTPALKKLVKNYDMIALATECRDIMGPNVSEHSWGDLPEPRGTYINPWPAHKARELFLKRHTELRERMGIRAHDA